MASLQLGSAGLRVTALQQQLQQRGFDPGGVDGQFGPATDAAVPGVPGQCGGARWRSSVLDAHARASKIADDIRFQVTQFEVLNRVEVDLLRRLAKQPSGKTHRQDGD